MSEATEKLIAAAALAFIVWGLLVLGPLLVEGFAR